MRENTILCLKVEHMKKILLFVLVCLVSVSFSSLIWKASTNGEVTTKPVYFQNNIAVGSMDGNIYNFNPDSGSVSWRYQIGTDILDFTIFDSDLVAATTEGKIAKLRSGGAVHWTLDLNELYNVSYIYETGSNSNFLFAATSEGIYKITKSGDASRIYVTESPPTALAVGSNYLIVGAGNKLIRMNENGNVHWERELESDNFWNSNPVISEADNSVYIGALDNRLHAYYLTGGAGEKWDVITGGWVSTTPLLADSVVFFGSNDGYVYAVNAANGNIQWKNQLPLAVVSEPEKGVMGGVEVIFVGGTDSSIYALEMQDGDVLWKGSADGRVGSPLFYQKEVIFGSSDGQVYAYTTERACSIDSPMDGEFVAHKEVVIHGQSVSEAGGQTVQVNINKAGWEDTNTSADGEWFLIADPGEVLFDGLNTISCRVVDSRGQETGTAFTTVSIIRDSTLPLDDLLITFSTNYIVEGQEFTIYVNSKSDGSPVDRFSLTIDGEEYTSSKNLTLALGEATSYSYTVSKMGFDDYKGTVSVSYAGIDPLYIGIAVVLVLIIIWVIYSRFIRKPKVEGQ